MTSRNPFLHSASSPLSGAVSRFRSLTPGDRLVVGVLGSVLIILLATGLYTLERELLVEVPGHGGSLTEGVVGHPRFVNPLLALSDADRDLASLTYAGLMGYDEHGHLVPVLAESYEISEDGTTYLFVLRDDATFSDGTPVTAEDIVFTIEKVQDPGLKSPRLADFANIAVEAVDARTVRFALPSPYAPFLEDATLGILPAHIWSDMTNEEFPFSPYMEEPIGAGPFKVANISRDKEGVIERYALTRFEEYALVRPYLARITFVYFKDEEALREAYSRGRVESAYGIPSEDALRAPYSRVFGAFFNQAENQALGSIEVRHALSVALDRDALIRDAFGGYAIPAYGPVPPGLVATALPEPVEDRIGTARALLEEDGWTFNEESRVWENDGTELRITLTTGNVPELKAVAERLKADWETLGVPTSLEFHDANDLVLSAIRPRKYEALLFGMVVGRDKDLFAFWDASQRTDPGLNISMYANRAVDELLDELREESDPWVVEETLKEIDALVAADYPAVFTHAPDFLYAIPADLEGVALGHVAEPSDRLTGAAFWYRHTEHIWPVFVGGK